LASEIVEMVVMRHVERRQLGMRLSVNTSAAKTAVEETAPHEAGLTAAPAGKLHRVELAVVDKELEVAPGVRQKMWSFNGSVPGPVLRGKIGDVFEVTLTNNGSLGHGIDFHAGALAPDGPMRTIQPGERLTYRFRAERAGVWMYHCSTAPMTQHIGAGMFGAVIIDPPDLAPVDREYLLVSSELYYADAGDGQAAKLRAGTPDSWAFNGVAHQYDRFPLTAGAGERVRFWLLNGSSTSSVPPCGSAASWPWHSSSRRWPAS
jgi:nitrite reductase (NO-forming)